MTNKSIPLVFFFLVGAYVFAVSPYASITYAEGSSFVLVRNGKASAWQVSSPAVIGMEIRQGDIIQTGAGTFMELAIHPISAAIQLAENTSFRCDADATGTKSTGELFYGRVRAKVARLTGTSSYRISSPSLVAGVRGTDFGCDVIALRPSGAAGTGASTATTPNPATGNSPILDRVFCFEGSVLVAETSGSAMNTVLIGPEEMVEKVVSPDLKAASDASATLQKKVLSPEVDSFWKARPITAIPAPVPVASGFDGTLTITDRPWPEGRNEKTVYRNRAIPSAMAFALIGLGSLSCAGAAAWSSQVDSGNPLVAPANSAGLIMIGSGTVLALLSLIAR
jgi:hypothetical protein